MGRKLFKTKILTIITAVALFVGVGVVYGFTSTKKTEEPKAGSTTNKSPLKRVVTEVWYSLTPTSSISTSSQIINSGQISEPTGEDCNVLNEGDFCAVKLRFDNVTPPASYPSGTSVATADAAPGVSIAQSSGQDVYSREREQ